MIWLGYKRKLVFNDLYALLNRDKCKTLWPELEREWQKELRKSKRQAKTTQMIDYYNHSLFENDNVSGHFIAKLGFSA